jgi:hypothetical protein
MDISSLQAIQENEILRKRLAKWMARFSFRDTKLEDLHDRIRRTVRGRGDTRVSRGESKDFQNRYHMSPPHAVARGLCGIVCGGCPVIISRPKRFQRMR